MATRLNPYISFNGNAREALEFYKEVFGGTLALSTFGEFGNPGEGGDKIMHGMLETDQGYTLMGADTPPGMPYNPGDNITVSLSGDDGDVLRGYWEQLSGTGAVSVPLEKQMWGDEFGRLYRQIRYFLAGEYRSAPELTPDSARFCRNETVFLPFRGRAGYVIAVTFCSTRQVASRMEKCSDDRRYCAEAPFEAAPRRRAGASNSGG